MSRKRKAPVRKVYPDPKFRSELVSKFINCIMYDGKRSTAERILYGALDKIQESNKQDPIKTFMTLSTTLNQMLNVDLVELVEPHIKFQLRLNLKELKH